MKIPFVAIALVFLAGTLVVAQITVENPQKLEWPEQRAQMLHRIICGVVGKQLHLHGNNAQFPVILVLGEPEQKIVVDEDRGIFKIYLSHWHEPSFAISDLQLVLQRGVVRRHWQPMVSEVVQRFQQVAPVSAGDLSGSSPPMSPSAASWPFPELDHQPPKCRD